jgi:hypothetical protein
LGDLDGVDEAFGGDVEERGKGAEVGGKRPDSDGPVPRAYTTITGTSERERETDRDKGER